MCRAYERVISLTLVLRPPHYRIGAREIGLERKYPNLKLTVLTLAAIIASVLLAQEGINWFYRDNIEQINAQWWRETKALNRIASELVRADVSHSEDIGIAFNQKVGEWLGQEFPEVILERADITPHRSAGGEITHWQVGYRLANQGSIAESSYCLDLDGERRMCPNSVRIAQ